MLQVGLARGCRLGWRGVAGWGGVGLQAGWRGVAGWVAGLPREEGVFSEEGGGLLEARRGGEALQRGRLLQTLQQLLGRGDRSLVPRAPRVRLVRPLPAAPPGLGGRRVVTTAPWATPGPPGASARAPQAVWRLKLCERPPLPRPQAPVPQGPPGLRGRRAPGRVWPCGGDCLRMGRPMSR